jgi:hypothetical protein
MVTFDKLAVGAVSANLVCKPKAGAEGSKTLATFTDDGTHGPFTDVCEELMICIPTTCTSCLYSAFLSSTGANIK